MVRLAVAAASAVLLSVGVMAESGDDAYDAPSGGVPAGQAETYDQYAHGNGSLGTLSQSDLDHFLGDDEGTPDAQTDTTRDENTDTQFDRRGMASRDDAIDRDVSPNAPGSPERNAQPDARGGSTPDQNTVGRSQAAAVAKVAKFNPADFVSLDAVHGRDLAGAAVETRTGKSIGHVGKVANARGHVTAVTVDLDSGRSVKIGADKLRYNRKEAFLLTNLNTPELEQQAVSGGR